MNHGNIDADTAESLKLLSNTIKEFEVPPSKLDETLIVASWNIREFGKKRRPKKALHLVAEILGQFESGRGCGISPSWPKPNPSRSN